MHEADGWKRKKRGNTVDAVEKQGDNALREGASTDISREGRRYRQAIA